MDNFEQFGREWDSIESPGPKSHEEIEQMCNLSNHPRIRGMKKTLWIEAILIGIFSVVIGVLADLLHAAWWLNLAFIVSLLLYFFTDFLGYIHLKDVPMEGNIKDSVIKFGERMKRLEILSICVTALLGMTTISVFAFRVSFIGRNPFIWIIMFAGMMFAAWLSSRKWTRRVAENEALLEAFEEDEAFDEYDGYDEVEEVVIR
jgi:signal transduction histidine kinase